jgi:hypothetical protein
MVEEYKNKFLKKTCDYIIKSNLMKNLFITLCLVLTSLTLTAQEAYNGMWLNEESTYVKTIIASEYKVLQVFNTSFDELRVITETIVSQGTKGFVTKLHNEQNGYTVTIAYRIQKDGTILSSYHGDLNNEYIITKLY